MPIVDWDSEQQRPRKLATYDSKCEACDEMILEGDAIVLDDDVWVHESCAND